MKKNYTSKIRYYLTIILCLFLYSNQTNAQNTVGVTLNTANAYDGYTLFTVNFDTYLMNNCGEVINKWTSAHKTGKSVYLLENGNLLRAALIDNPGNIAIPGIGGRIELFDWDGNLIWEFDFTTNTSIQHHDIYPMPNGNILVLGATILTDTEAFDLGRDPSKLSGNQLYNEQIVELEPVGSSDANVVWQWDVKDHLIQDFDNTKSNFGVISEHPEKLDINQIGISNGNANWLHANSIQYNEDLDQIVISFRNLSEIYIIDHSTTTSEAASNSGGTYQKGGDFLYRWGNPQIYGQGTATDQQLFHQHYPHWIPEGSPDGGKIIMYNNGLNRTPSFSEVFIINPLHSQGVYSTTNGVYGPTTPDFTYQAPTPTDFYSAILSSAQRLPNGNTLICEGTSSHFFEIDANKEIVWEYFSPITDSSILSQGDSPESSTNLFRVKKYAKDYAGFTGKDLTPGLPIELNSNNSQCTILNVSENEINNIVLFPNPVKDVLNISSQTEITKIEIYNLLGVLIGQYEYQKELNLSNLKPSIYFIKLYNGDKVTEKRFLKL